MISDGMYWPTRILSSNHNSIEAFVPAVASEMQRMFSLIVGHVKALFQLEAMNLIGMTGQALQTSSRFTSL